MNIKYKDSITRKEEVAINNALFKGATSTDNGVLDQTSVLSNLSEQENLIVLTFVKEYDGKPLTLNIIESMDSQVFAEISKECGKLFKGLKEKKS